MFTPKEYSNLNRKHQNKKNPKITKRKNQNLSQNRNQKAKAKVKVKVRVKIKTKEKIKWSFHHSKVHHKIY